MKNDLQSTKSLALVNSRSTTARWNIPKPLLKQKKSTRYFIKAVTALWTEKNNCNKEPTSRLVSDPT